MARSITKEAIDAVLLPAWEANRGPHNAVREGCERGCYVGLDMSSATGAARLSLISRAATAASSTWSPSSID